MSNGDIEPYEWFNRFFGNLNSINRIGRGMFGTRDIFRDFEDMHKEMDRMFNVFTNMSSNASKELVREYQTQQGDKIREVGPIVYGYSMTVGPDGKPHIREFGNIKSFDEKGEGKGEINPQISAEREPLADINSTQNEVKVVFEMPGTKKEDIKINAYDGAVEVISDNPKRKYHKTIELPKDADIETAKSTYNNGILEVTFDRKKNDKPKGKEIKVE